MANVDGARGFIPVRHMRGGNMRRVPYTIASGYATNLFRGDPVELTGTSNNVQVAAAANTDNLGVFDGCKYTNAAGEVVYSSYWPASTVSADAVAFVYDDPDIVFEIQCDSATNFALNDIGGLADWVAGTGDAATGQSGYELQLSSIATTGKSCRILGLVNRPDNAVGQHAKVEVLFIEHVMRGVVAGVGGV